MMGGERGKMIGQLFFCRERVDLHAQSCWEQMKAINWVGCWGSRLECVGRGE